MEKSTHKVEVIRVDKIEKHPNADSLGIINVFGGYPVIVRLSDWQVGDMGAYVPPDSLVPLDREEFAFLKDRPDGKREIGGKVYHLVRSIKLRKLPSLGLLLPVAKADASIGDDLAEYLGVIHYEPAVRNEKGYKGNAAVRKGLAEKKPFCNPPTYDLDALRRYNFVFEEGEPVYVTEKIHGANARYVWEDRGYIEKCHGGLRVGDYLITLKGVKKLPHFVRYLHVGSRNLWKKFNPEWITQQSVNDVWWEAILDNPRVSAFLALNPGYTVYGEVFGKTQDLSYGTPREARLALFDIRLPSGAYHPPSVFKFICDSYQMPRVPEVAYAIPFNMDKMIELAEGPSLVEKADHIREGIVVKPLIEREHPAVGRVALKLVGLGYYERKGE